MTDELREHRKHAGPTVVCAWCERVLHRGTADISHGICHSCAVEFIAAVTGETPVAAERRLATVI